MTLQASMKTVGVFFMTTLPFIIMRFIGLSVTQNDGVLGRFFFWSPGNLVYELTLMSITFVWGYYLYKAASQPKQNKLFIDFTIVATVLHGVIMGVYAVADSAERWHLIGDVPFLLMSAGLLFFASRKFKYVN